MSLVISETKVAQEENFPKLHITEEGWGEIVAGLQEMLPSLLCGSRYALPRSPTHRGGHLFAEDVIEGHIESLGVHYACVGGHYVGHQFILIIVVLHPQIFHAQMESVQLSCYGVQGSWGLYVALGVIRIYMAPFASEW